MQENKYRDDREDNLEELYLLLYANVCDRMKELGLLEEIGASLERTKHGKACPLIRQTREFLRLCLGAILDSLILGLARLSEKKSQRGQTPLSLFSLTGKLKKLAAKNVQTQVKKHAKQMDDFRVKVDDVRNHRLAHNDLDVFLKDGTTFSYGVTLNDIRNVLAAMQGILTHAEELLVQNDEELGIIRLPSARRGFEQARRRIMRITRHALANGKSFQQDPEP